jgi:hypothetical protein
MNYKGPRLKAKLKKYHAMSDFHDSDNCNTMFIHHLCREFPDAKVLLPIGPVKSFIRAHRAWGIMDVHDRNTNTRAYPLNVKGWNSWPIVVKLAWLWGKRNAEAVKRADRKRLMVFRTKHITTKLAEIFEFIEQPLNKKATKLATVRHNKLRWPSEAVTKAEQEIQDNIGHIERVVAPFKRTISRWYKVF